MEFARFFAVRCFEPVASALPRSKPNKNEWTRTVKLANVFIEGDVTLRQASANPLFCFVGPADPRKMSDVLIAGSENGAECAALIVYYGSLTDFFKWYGRKANVRIVP